MFLSSLSLMPLSDLMPAFFILAISAVRFDLYIDEDKAKHIHTDKGKYRDKGVDIEEAMDNWTYS